MRTDWRDVWTKCLGGMKVKVKSPTGGCYSKLGIIKAPPYLPLSTVHICSFLSGANGNHSYKSCLGFVAPYLSYHICPTVAVRRGRCRAAIGCLFCRHGKYGNNMEQYGTNMVRQRHCYKVCVQRQRRCYNVCVPQTAVGKRIHREYTWLAPLTSNGCDLSSFHGRECKLVPQHSAV